MKNLRTHYESVKEDIKNDALFRRAILEEAAVCMQLRDSESAKVGQRLLDLVSEVDEGEGLRAAREGIAGHTHPAREVFAEMRKKYNIPE